MRLAPTTASFIQGAAERGRVPPHRTVGAVGSVRINKRVYLNVIGVLERTEKDKEINELRREVALLKRENEKLTREMDSLRQVQRSIIKYVPDDKLAEILVELSR